MEFSACEKELFVYLRFRQRIEMSHSYDVFFYCAQAQRLLTRFIVVFVSSCVVKVFFLKYFFRRGIAQSCHQVRVGENQFNQFANQPAKQLADLLVDVRQTLPHPDCQ